MPDTAGFAIIGSVSERFVNACLRTAAADLLPAYLAPLTGPVVVAGVQGALFGSVAMLAPTVSFSSRPDNQVPITLTFGGAIALALGTAPPTEVVVSLSTTVLAQPKATPVPQPPATPQSTATVQLVLSLDVSKAQVTAVEAAAVTGPQLDQGIHEVLTSSEVLSLLAQAVQAIPANLLQLPAGTLSLPLTVAQTYQPPNATISSPRTLYSLQYDVTNVAIRPVDAAVPGPGALAVGVDIEVPGRIGADPSVTTSGNPAALYDLNTAPGPVPVMIDYNSDGTANFAPGGGTAAQNTDLAVAVNASWLCTVINQVLSPQLVGVFMPGGMTTNKLSFTKNAQIADGEVVGPMAISIGDVQAGLNGPLTGAIPSGVAMSGFTVDLWLTRWQEVSTDADGYYDGVDNVPGNVNAQVTASLALLLQSFSQPPTIPTQGGVGTPGGNLLVQTDPPGGYVLIDGAPVGTGFGPYSTACVPLPPGTYTVGADPAIFKSWVTAGGVQVDSATANPANITVSGTGQLTLNATDLISFISYDYWSAGVIGVEVSLPAWVQILPEVLTAMFLAGVLLMQLNLILWSYAGMALAIGPTSAILGSSDAEATAAALGAVGGLPRSAGPSS